MATVHTTRRHRIEPLVSGYARRMSVDPRAASGFADVAHAYAQGRPSYPVEAIDHIVAGFQLDEASSVLDLAAGTGQLSRLFRMRVRRVIAVEPASAMRARIAADLPDVTIVGGHRRGNSPG